METKEKCPLWTINKMQKNLNEETYFTKECKAIIQQLTSRKYPLNLLEEALEKVKKLDRLQLLRKSEKNQPHKIRLVTHYNPSNPNFDQYYKNIQDYY